MSIFFIFQGIFFYFIKISFTDTTKEPVFFISSFHKLL